jgi:hypothetical protein
VKKAGESQGREHSVPVKEIGGIALAEAQKKNPKVTIKPGTKDENRGAPLAFCQFPTWPNNGARTKLRAQVLDPTIVSALLTGGGRHTFPMGGSHPPPHRKAPLWP